MVFINDLVEGQLSPSIITVSPVPSSFCTNIIMIQDKYSNGIKDLTISSVKKSTLALSYYIASLVANLIVCYITMGVCLIYIGISGWYLTIENIFLLSAQGQTSAVGTIATSLYGFICGAYMAMSQFSEGLQTALGFLPGTYGTVLLRNQFSCSSN